VFISEFHKKYRKNGLNPEIIKIFQDLIYSYYKNYGRDFPFRNTITPYNVLVSEIMLQQTQTGTVSEKFLKFTELYPNFISLAETPLENILKAWQGLGYNRRAVALKKIAEIVIREYNGELPNSLDALKSFPQIGHNTASSIIIFAFNEPAIFIETNIRRVFLYFFFSQKQSVKDKEILPLIHDTMDIKNPRNWYYALMDYGVMLKKKHPELNKKSAHYRKQSQFKGSNREIRGKILKVLLDKKSVTEIELIKMFNVKPERINNVLDRMVMEGFLKKLDCNYSISK